MVKRGSARGWKKCGCYVWRTRKPTAFLGLSLRWLLLAAVLIGAGLWLAGAPWWPVLVLPLFSGRHTAYVGETGNRYFRDNQHLFGDSRYRAAGKPWADLDPRVYPLPCLFPSWPTARKIQEKLYIWTMLPIYNVEWNTKNPRRITPMKAQQQRWARQKSGLKVNVGRTLARWALGLVVLAGGIAAGWEKWLS